MQILQKMLDKFSVFDLIIIAMISTLGIASKPVIVPLSHIITGPLLIPGGVVAGGFICCGWYSERESSANRVQHFDRVVQALMVFGTGFLAHTGL